VLWELQLVIEFPAGSTVLIPSAAINHSNTTIGADERRQSFTQYSSGSMFRYVDNGYKTSKAYMAGLKRRERDAVHERQSKQLQDGLALYSTVSELCSTSNL
jgi:predicted N-acyltransferase